MWCSKEINGANIVASNSFGDWSLTDYKEPDNEEQQSHLRNPQAIVIVEPRQIRATGPSSSTPPNPEWFMLPQAVDVNNDVMRLVSSLSTVVQILTRMTNAAAQELRQHPEREEGFQGLRMLLNYADQMYTTLLQPQNFPAERPASERPGQVNAYSLFHHLFEPMLNSGPRTVEESSSRLADRSSSSSTHRTYPHRVSSSVAESDTSLDLSL
ncbi:hypothetical protein ACLKA7_003613 [Drosophila subpalustris]